MTEARQHHVVPKCYLKHFTHNGSKNSKLFVVDLERTLAFTSSPHNVAKRRDFNRIEGKPAGVVEKHLSKFESELAKALERIAADRSLADRDAWLHVVKLIALLAIRNPRWRENVRRFQEQICKQIMSLSLATPERWAGQVRQMQKAGVWKEEEPTVSYDQLKNFHEAGRYRVETSTAMHLLLEFRTLGEVIQVLAARQWTLLTAPTASGGFITSDHPVCLMHSDGSEDRPMRPIGFGLKNTAVIFPLTRELMVVGTFEGSGGLRELTPLQVSYFNVVVASFAERQVYAADDRFRFMAGEGAEMIFGAELPAFLRGGMRAVRPAAETT